MNSQICIVCRQTLPTLKTLQNHLLKTHSKLALVKSVIKLHSNKNFTRNTIQSVGCKDRNEKQKIKKNKLEDISVTQSDIEDDSDMTEQVYLIALDENTYREKYSSPSEQNSNTEVALSLNNNYVSSPKCIENSYNQLNIRKPFSSDSKEDSSLTIKSVSSDPGCNRFSGIIQLKESIGSICRRNCKQSDSSTDTAEENASLNEESGNFYVCNCMKKEIDSESNSIAEQTGTCLDKENSCDFEIFYCNTCGSDYTSKDELMEHSLVHLHQCPICKCAFVYQNDYMSHLETHYVRIYVCHYCQQEFSQKAILAHHLDEHFKNEFFDNILALEEEYKVATYNKHLFDGYTLNNNCYYFERPESLNKYSFCCDICRITFYNFLDYQLHLRSHYSM